MSLRADTRRGYSLIELMVTIAISSLILFALAGVLLAASKGLVVVTDQARRQSEAGMALDRTAEILRNAVYPVTLVASSEVQFTDGRNPDETARIWLSGDRLMYDPDISESGDQRELARGIDDFEVGPDSDPLIGASALTLQISYNYQNFRDRFPEASRNATFVTSVFMRNTN
jgi:prepilin-type N-terminal cleavage/methylation domain-containing protein